MFVIFNHLGIQQLLPQQAFFRLRIFPLFSGVTGVNIFFVLSGFLITWLLINELVKTGKINFIHFFARRFLRLLPPLIVFFTCLLLLMHFTICEPITRLFYFQFSTCIILFPMFFLCPSFPTPGHSQ